jgi:MOSC domain-containing protein YiiM
VSSGQEIPDGQFGENLTTQGVDVNEAEIGERWQIGEVLLEVRSIRTPCNDFKAWTRPDRESPGESREVRRRAALTGTNFTLATRELA